MINVIDEKLGYYHAGGQKFSSKIAAALHSIKTNTKLHWNFNDEIFSKHDWSKEPLSTLDELYDARSRELREKYDYLILSYSGGSDSHNILMSFIRQGLHLDEIIINHMNKANDQFTDLNPTNKNSTNAAAEFHLQTLPRLKEVENLIPQTKITILDLTDYLFQSLEKIGDASWVLDKKEQVNIAGMTRFNYIFFDDIRKNFDKGRKLGLITGLEKPRSFIENGEYHLLFTDRPANIITVKEHMHEYTNCSVEMFYWSPSPIAIQIMTKQAHTIKKYLEMFPQKQELWKIERLHSGTMIRIIHERILRTLLYTTWDNNWYQADKAIKDWHSEFDQWFFDHYTDTKTFHIWKEGIDYLKNNLSSLIKYDDNTADGLVPFHKKYKVGPIKRY
jgi:hypothetical protein